MSIPLYKAMLANPAMARAAYDEAVAGMFKRMLEKLEKCDGIGHDFKPHSDQILSCQRCGVWELREPDLLDTSPEPEAKAA